MRTDKLAELLKQELVEDGTDKNEAAKSLLIAAFGAGITSANLQNALDWWAKPGPNFIRDYPKRGVK